MSQGNRSNSQRSLIRMLAFVLVFIAGVAVGIYADRAGVVTVFAPEPVTPKQRLLGKWVSEKSKVEFKSDGTFDEAYKQERLNLNPGEVPSDPSQLKTVEFDASITGQYQWISAERIEIKESGKRPRSVKIVIDGESLTLLEDDGKVSRLKRAN